MIISIIKMIFNLEFIKITLLILQFIVNIMFLLDFNIKIGYVLFGLMLINFIVNFGKFIYEKIKI
jgi:hypothetical protein